jgi:hypothetical protein
LQPDDLVAGLKGVGWAGHGFGAETGAAALRGEGVCGVELEDGVGLVYPQRGGGPVAAGQPYPGFPVGVAGQSGECEVDLEALQYSRLREVEGGAGDQFAANW